MKFFKVKVQLNVSIGLELNSNSFKNAFRLLNLRIRALEARQTNKANYLLAC